MLTQKQIDRKVRGAFLPFRCAVEFFDSDAKLRVKVFDHSRRGILKITKIPVTQVRDERTLRDILSRLRRAVQKMGYNLYDDTLRIPDYGY
jgi:hypothetical protein